MIGLCFNVILVFVCERARQSEGSVWIQTGRSAIARPLIVFDGTQASQRIFDPRLGFQSC